MGVAALTERVLGVAQANAAFDEATLRYTLAREHSRGMLVYGKVVPCEWKVDEGTAALHSPSCGRTNP